MVRLLLHNQVDINETADAIVGWTTPVSDGHLHIVELPGQVTVVPRTHRTPRPIENI